MKKYVGITIGPIFETMSFTSTPAGLWYASYFYSCLTKNICRYLKNGFDIYTIPDKEIKADGIGRYHDRIYCSYKSANISDEELAKCLNVIINDAIKDNVKILSSAIEEDEDKTYEELKNFLQVHYVIKDFNDGDKLAKGLADLLDAMELSENVEFNVSANPFKILFRTGKEKHNEHLKKIDDIRLVQNLFDNKDDKIKDLSSIARIASPDYDKSKKKLNKYFAFVKADGDNMGKVIGFDGDDTSLKEQENRIKLFSNLCFTYIDNSIQEINNYGGVTIYGGGDDLLFLAPLIGKNGKTIFDLCGNINTQFNNVFNKDNKDTEYTVSGITKSVLDSATPSLSFGVSINYVKFPLYESNRNASELLGNSKNGSKNNVTVNVHKHSGQSAKFTCNVNSKLFTLFSDLANMFINDEDGKDEMAIRSFIYHIESFKQMFKHYFKSTSEIKENALIDNLFDSDLRDEGKKIKQMIAEIMYEIKNSDPVNLFAKDALNQGGLFDSIEDIKTSILVSMLRVAKFMCEEEKDV